MSFSLYREYDGKDGGDQADASHAEEDPRGLLRDRTHDRPPGQPLRVKLSGISSIFSKKKNRTLADDHKAEQGGESQGGDEPRTTW